MCASICSATSRGFRRGLDRSFSTPATLQPIAQECNFNICLSYSSRWEITDAARKLAKLVAEGKIEPDSITEEMVADNLTTTGMPDPDLLIRTGGEERVSNYLLWQIAYSELYFTPVLWLDFSNEEYVDAIIDFQNRERRFGKTSEQVQNNE